MLRTAEAAPLSLPTVPRWRRSRFRAMLWGCLCGLVLATAVEARRVFLGANVHTVVPGRVYRCAQPAAAALEQLVKAYGLRTVVNLRGCGNPLPWYLEESRATHALDVAHEDICFSAGRLPSAPELGRLVEVLDRAEYPLLLHCRRGADRTGLAATVVRLLQTDEPLAPARRQLSLRYGHIALGRPAYLDQFFDLYADWLRLRGIDHAPAAFRHW